MFFRPVHFAAFWAGCLCRFPGSPLRAAGSHRAPSFSQWYIQRMNGYTCSSPDSSGRQVSCKCAWSVDIHALIGSLGGLKSSSLHGLQDRSARPGRWRWSGAVCTCPFWRCGIPSPSAGIWYMTQCRARDCTDNCRNFHSLHQHTHFQDSIRTVHKTYP